MKRIYVTFAALSLLALFVVSASACDFYFSCESISVPIGTVGEVGIQVQKTHAKCTLSSMDDYVIDGEGLQILGETAWEDLDGNLYEKCFQISLSEEGDGFLRISKTCTKEGYEERVLPITVLAPDENAVWTVAWSGEYPFEASGDVVSVLASAAVSDGSLELAGLALTLPDGAVLPSNLPESVRVFYAEIEGRSVPLLLVGEGLFVRFDHLIA